MKIIFDTSVLVSAVVADLKAHEVAAECFTTYTGSKHEAFCSTHAIAECYSTLTSLPLRRKIQPVEAIKLIEENFFGKIQVTDVSGVAYKRALSRVVDLGLVSGIIYDALHLECAEGLGCKRLYTFNLKHFRRLEPSGVTVLQP